MDNDQKCDYASYLSLIGGYYRHLGNHHKSIEYDIRAKKVYEDIQGYNSYRCNINYTLALAYIELGQLEEAKNNIQIMEDMFNGGLVDKADIITSKLTLCKILNSVKMENGVVVAYNHLKALTLFGKPFCLFYVQFF